MIGHRLAHYEVLESLGAGGMGEVYRARDTRLGREVAVKILPLDRPLNATSRQRFQREAMAASSLNHPNIITIYEINNEGSTDFIAMEYVRGQTLAQLLKRGRLSIHQVLRYAVQIADAVSKAHGAGIIHRDLKPGNVMVTDDGLVKVLDFGLAKFNKELSGDASGAHETTDPQISLTMPGSTTGTLAYMSPEQARGERVDARSDIFSFGIVLFQLLSGELPFAGTNQLSLMHNLHFSPPKALGKLRDDVPEPLADLVASMLAKEPEKRVQTMPEVANHLRWIAQDQQLSLSQEPTLSPTMASFRPLRLSRPMWWKKRAVWIPAVVALLVLVALGGWWRLRRRPAQQSASAGAVVVDDNAFALYKVARDQLDHFHRPGADDRAIKLLQRAIQLDPNSAVSYAALAEAYARKNSANPDPQWVKLASDAAGKALQLNSDLAASHVAHGIALMQAKNFGESEKEFRKAAELDPKSSTPHRWLGTLLNKNQKLEEAKGELNKAQELNPNDWRIFLDLGLNAYLRSNYKDAAEYWEQSLKLEPENASVLLNLGAVYHGMGRDDDAAQALQRSLEITPDVNTYNNLGTIRFFQGRYADSVPAFEKALAMGANQYDSWGNLADAYRWTPGDEEKAKQAYQHAVQLLQEEIMKTPNDLDMRATLATYLAKLGDKPAALQELKTVESGGKKEALTLYRMATVYELCGKRDESIAALAASVKAGQSLDDIKNDPELTSLRSDPRYHLQILAKEKPGS